MKKNIELLPPLMPNFITYKLDGAVSESVTNAPKIEVKSLSEDEANEYAELMAMTFRRHWRDKKNEKEQPIARDGKPWDGILKEDR